MGGIPYDDLTLRVLQASTGEHGEKQHILVISEYNMDGFVSTAILQERLLKVLSIPSSVYFMETLDELGELGPRLASLSTDRRPLGGVVILGFDQTLYEFAFQLQSASPTSIPIFHIAREFRNVPFHRDVNLSHYLPVYNTREDNELKATMELFDRPSVTLQVALAILDAGLSLTGAHNLVAVVMASMFHHGELDHAQYNKYFDKVMSSTVLQSKHGDISVDDEGLLEQQSSICVFPGLFFHNLSMQENFKYSSVLQKHLHDLPRESWDTEESQVRVRLKMAVEDWTSTVSGLPARKQTELMKKLPSTKMLDYEPTNPMNQRQCVTFTARKDGARNKTASNIKRLTNFDVAFILDTELDGARFKGRRPNGSEKRSKDWEGLSTITHQLTSNAMNALHVFKAFIPVMGVDLGHQRPPLWVNKTRQNALQRAIASYKKLGEKCSVIFDLLKEKSSRPERMASQAFRASAGLVVVYLTETSHNPLRVIEASYLMIALSQALKDQYPTAPPVLLLQAGTDWTRLSMTHISDSRHIAQRETLGRFKDLSKEHVVSLGQMLNSSQHVLVVAGALWQVFIKSFERVVHQEDAPGGRRKRRRHVAPT